MKFVYYHTVAIYFRAVISTLTGTVTADGLTVDGQADFESGASLGSGLNVNRSGHPSYGIVTGGNTEVYHAVKPNGGSWQTYMKVTDDGDINFYEDTGTTAKFTGMVS